MFENSNKGKGKGVVGIEPATPFPYLYATKSK